MDLVGTSLDAHLTVRDHQDKTRTWNQRIRIWTRIRVRVRAGVRERVRVEVRVLV